MDNVLKNIIQYHAIKEMRMADFSGQSIGRYRNIEPLGETRLGAGV